MNLQNYRFKGAHRLNPLYCGAIALSVIISSAFFLSKFPKGHVLDFAHFMSDTGNVLFLVCGYLALIIAAIAIKNWRNLMLAFTVLIIVTFFVQLIKHFDLGAIAMRPCGGGEGFPSGHTAGAIALAFLLSLRFSKATVIWYTWAGAIAWSRVQANAHYPFQVAAGAVFGLLTAYLLVNMFSKQPRSPAGGPGRQESTAAEAAKTLNRQ
ncbi:MAG TPA: hypothetical protein DCL60_12260 [Armatimonadetes bacterium]|jgi:membrane-associated phospholipid phosphatase|nr:hypothetical protein [Armatimonadota bacterium]